MTNVQHILAVRSAPLNVRYPGTNFSRLDKSSILNLLRECGVWVGPRAYLEHDRGFRQVIPYVLVRSADKYLSYQRSRHGAEQRLHGVLSVGIGGHIDITDVDAQGSEIDLERTISRAADRECEEEVGEINVVSKEWLGILVDHSNDVGCVHVGVVIRCDVVGNIHGGSDQSIAKVELLSQRQLIARNGELESWSQLLIAEL